jgi:hypothetical protein
MRPVPFLLSICLIIGYKLLNHFLEKPYYALLIFVPIVLLIGLNLVLRRKLKYKDWFIKHLGFLNEKVTHSFKSEIPAPLLFDKILEQINDSETTLYDFKPSTLEILAGNSVGMRTWGENIYIDINATDSENPTVNLTSVTVFGIVSWNKNKENIDQFYSSFEESLTI